MDRNDHPDDTMRGRERGGAQEHEREPGHGPGPEPAEQPERHERAQPDGASYPPEADEPHVAGGREPVERSAVEPASSRLDDRSRMKEIMKRVNDALHRVRPTEDRER